MPACRGARRHSSWASKRVSAFGGTHIFISSLSLSLSPPPSINPHTDHHEPHVEHIPPTSLSTVESLSRGSNSLGAHLRYVTLPRATTAVANDMTARSNSLLTMTTANSIGLAAVQTTVDSAQAAMTLQGQAIQAAVAAQGVEISANVASQAVQIAADTSTQLASSAEQIAATRAQLAAVQSSLAAATASLGTEITAVTSNITALQNRSSGKMIGFQQCEVSPLYHSDTGPAPTPTQGSRTPPGVGRERPSDRPLC